MKINEAKKERQQEGVYKWVKNKCNGILNWATGVGKTYGAVLAIEYIETKRTPTYLIVLPSQVVMKQWIDMFSTFFNEEQLSRITFKTINELEHEKIVYEVDVFIIDEIHEYTTNERIAYITGVKIHFKAILGLTASVTEYEFKRITRIISIVDVISEEEAKEKNFIAKFHEFNIELQLTEAEKKRYDLVTEKINAHLPKFDNNLDTAQKCLNGGYQNKGGKSKYYSAIQWSTTYAMSKGWYPDMNLALETNRAIFDLWHPNKIIGYAKSLIGSIRTRKSILEHSEEKIKTTIELLNKFNKVKTIVFSESTDVVDELYETLKPHHKVGRFHSNLLPIMEPSRTTGKIIKKGSKRQKDETIADFKASKIRIMLATRALDRGLDDPKIRLGITVSGSSKTKQYEQRGGRVKRLEESNEESNPFLFGGVKALLINLYIKDTQDEIWLKNRQKHVEHFIYNVTSIDDISYTPPANEEFVVDF